MTSYTKEMSTFRAALRVYDFWRFKAFVYLVVLSLATIVALVLDLRFGIPQGTVLLYLVPLMTFLFITATLVCVAAKRAAFTHSGAFARKARSLLHDSFGVSQRYPRRGLAWYTRSGDGEFGGDEIEAMTESQITVRPAEDIATLCELRELRDQMVEEILRGLHDAIIEQTKSARRTTRRYSPTGRGRTDGRPFRFSRRDPESYKRA